MSKKLFGKEIVKKIHRTCELTPEKNPVFMQSPHPRKMSPIQDLAVFTRSRITYYQRKRVKQFSKSFGFDIYSDNSKFLALKDKIIDIAAYKISYVGKKRRSTILGRKLFYLRCYKSIISF